MFEARQPVGRPRTESEPTETTPADRPKTRSQPRAGACRTIFSLFSLWLLALFVSIAPSGAQSAEAMADPPRRGLAAIYSQVDLEGLPGTMNYGAGLDVDGITAVVSAPFSDEIFVHSFDPNADQWGAGLSVSIPAGMQVGTPVAVSGLNLYYILITDDDPLTWEVKERSLFPPSVGTIFSRTGSRPPDSLAVRNGILVVGWRPIGLVKSEFVIWRKIGGTWQLQFGESVGALGLDDSQVGWDVDTDGERVAVGDPKDGAQGLVRIYRQVLGGSWERRDAVYENLLQPEDIGFGEAVAIDGDCLAVGAPRLRGGIAPAINGIGGAQIYVNTSLNTWIPNATVVPAEAGEDDNWGEALDLLGPNLLIAGEEVFNSAGFSQGDAALFHSSGVCGSNWTETQFRLRAAPLLPHPSAFAEFGRAVAMSYEAGPVVTDPLGPLTDFDGVAYAYSRGLLAIFTDGFETGDASQWQ